MKVIKWIFRFFTKLLGILPYKLLLRQRYYQEDPTKHGHGIKGGAIVIANHIHIMDYFTILFAHPFRKQRCLVSEAIYRHNGLGFLSKMMDNILVHRERSDLSFMNEAEKTLKKGQIVTIFPEGHLVKNGKLDTFKPSVVYLALRSGAPIIPHYIEPHYMSMKRTRIIMGKPIYIRDYVKSDNPSIEEVKELCEMLRNKTNELKRKLELFKKYRTRNVIFSKSFFNKISHILLYLPTKVIFPTKFHYVDGATKKDRRIRGSGLIVSNHKTFFDPPILTMHYMPRRVHTIIAQEMYVKHPWLFKHLLCIEYRRVDGANDPKCFLETINLLRAEAVVGIYPEGHLSKNGLLEFQKGAAYFAIMGHTKIYTYYMVNPHKVFHRNHIMIGKTFDVEKMYSSDELKNKETIAAFTNVLEAYFHSLEERGKIYQKNQKIDKK